MINKLRGILPKAVIAELERNQTLLGSPLRLAHFLAQCDHESAGFRCTEENLNYSDQALRSTFPKYFPSAALAREYQRQPERIASRVYANRMGNDDEASGDGYTYRGRGYPQLTGKDNYRAFGEFIGVDVVSNPDLVASDYPMLSARWFFDVNHIWSVCDLGSDNSTVAAVTKKVNGGTNGLSDRIRLFNRYYQAVKS